MSNRTGRTARPVSEHVEKYFWRGVDFAKTLESDKENTSLPPEKEDAVQVLMETGMTRDQALECLDGLGQKKLWMLGSL